jgi:transcriptional regulator with XRE-family HTH domain
MCVRTLREELGWTLEVAAERMNIDWKHLQKLESARLNPTLVTLIRVADGLGQPVERLFEAAPAAGRSQEAAE